ncbi:MAG: hypothetical protein KAR20_23265 [Candidatus Heimdallarchaeota archaeon]|nr:hypothetical protein [Candidatus Heimdallarchaeota archaeon]
MELIKLALIIIVVFAIWRITGLSAELFWDRFRNKIFPKGKWIMIDSIELINTLKDGDKIKYTSRSDRIPYKKGTIGYIEIEHYKEFREVAQRIYIKTILGTDMLLLNCITGYEIPYLGRGSILYLYRWEAEKENDPIIFMDPASKDGDYSAKVTAEREEDGTLNIIDVSYDEK